MDIHDFVLLDIEDRKALVLEKGVFLIHRKERNHRLSLYQFYDLYAEVARNYKTQKIENIRAFKGMPSLAPYLNHIHLEQMGL